MIESHGLTKQYGRYRAVQNVDLRVADGEVFGFLGLNGAGKTTVMRMICGLLRPTAGYARVDNVEVRGPEDTCRLIPTVSFVSQEMHFFERATVMDLLRTYATLAETAIDRGLAFARQAGVPLDRPCGTLSPGQQRKAQLAIALLKAPRYLFLDEPTAGLDPQGVAEMREIVRSLQAEGATVFLSSHVMGEVQMLCSSVGILHRGQLRYQSRVEEAYTIGVTGDPMIAAALLQSMGATAVPEGVRVAVSQKELPSITARLMGAGIAVGLIQATNLESLFYRIVEQAEVTA